jgi:sialate O-acetylesterase
LANVAFGKITLPSTIGDNMVLQKQSQVIIWGNSNQNVKINLISSWNEKSYQTFANSSGKWSLELTTPIAGEPYEIRLSD